MTTFVITESFRYPATIMQFRLFEMTFEIVMFFMPSLRLTPYPPTPSPRSIAPPSVKPVCVREIAALLDQATPEQTQILTDIVRAAKQAMDKYLP